MKKLFLFMALGLVFSSCTIDGNDTEDYTFNLVPVSSVDMPVAFAKDSITNIPVKYLRPTSCDFFNGFYYEKDGYERTVAVYCARLVQNNCQTDNVTEMTVNLPFKPGILGVYHFKFLTGNPSSINPQFIEFDVTVDH